MRWRCRVESPPPLESTNQPIIKQVLFQSPFHLKTCIKSIALELLACARGEWGYLCDKATIHQGANSPFLPRADRIRD